MTITLDLNKRIFLLVRAGENNIHRVVKRRTTHKKCIEAFNRNRRKEGLFILTEHQVREYEDKYKLRRRKRQNIEVSS